MNDVWLTGGWYSLAEVQGKRLRRLDRGKVGNGHLTNSLGGPAVES